MNEHVSFRFVVAVICAAFIASACTHDPRGERALAGSEAYPAYIASSPLGDSIAIMVGSRSSPHASGTPGTGTGVPAVEQYLEAFRTALVEALGARGYRAELVGRPKVTCSMMSGGSCAPRRRGTVRA